MVERDGHVAGYTTGLGYFGHSVAESNRDLQALIGAAEGFDGPGLLVPVRNAALFAGVWKTDAGCSALHPDDDGLYNEPAGAWIPSILM